MPQTLRYKPRRKVLTQACDLASSGKCANHHEVISRLMVTEDALIVRELLEDRRFCATRYALRHGSGATQRLTAAPRGSRIAKSG